MPFVAVKAKSDRDAGYEFMAMPESSTAPAERENNAGHGWRCVVFEACAASAASFVVGFSALTA
jgi:hypothetical protein